MATFIACKCMLTLSQLHATSYNN